MTILIAFLTTSLIGAGPQPAPPTVAPRGEIALRVITAQRDPIPGTTVTLLPADGAPGKTVIADASGQVRFAGLPQGKYLVRCEIAGFITETLGPIPIELKEPSPRLPEPIDVVMAAGPIWY